MKFLRKMLGLSDQPKEIPKPGRNEPCWCGSGRKYKKCHLEADLRKKRFNASSCKAPA
jgi:hypothetical protein